jgi:threonine/homoserine/homoserine lactone efflux protein
MAASYLIFAVSYAFAVTVQPGPLLTYIISRALSQGWRRTLPAAFSPIVSDAPIIVLVLLVLSRLSEGWAHYLQLAGGIFLLYLAWQAVKAFRRSSPEQTQESSSGVKSLLSAAGVNLLNPGPYLGWSLVMGPLLLKAWREAPALGLGLLACFYGTMIITLAGIIVLFSFARRLGPKVNKVLIAASAVALAGFASYELWQGIHGLSRGAR